MENDRMPRQVQDRTYFMRRAAQERSAADHAISPKARRAHKAMAEHYSELVHSVEQPERPSA
jgi:hypothetical protein